MAEQSFEVSTLRDTQEKENASIPILTDLQKTEIVSALTSNEVLGEGGYGKVLKMVHNSKAIAVKITEVQRGIKNDAENEAKCLAKLKSSGMVPELEFFFQDGVEYLGMSQCSQDLYHINHWEKEALQKFLHQGLHALEFCHRQKIVHRDVKLDNFMVSMPQGPQNSVKILLCDFGHATTFGREQKRLRSTNIFAKTKHSTPDVFGKLLEPFPKDDVVQLSYCVLHAVWHDQADFYGVNKEAKDFKKCLLVQPQECLSADKQWLLPFFEALAQSKGKALDYGILKASVQAVCPDSDPKGPLSLITNAKGEPELV